MNDKVENEIEHGEVRYIFSCKSECIDGDFQLFANKNVKTLYCPYCGKAGSFSEVIKFNFEIEGVPV